MPASVHPDCVAAVQDAASLCEELGHEVVELPPRHDPRALARAFFTVVCAQTAAELVEAEQRTGRRATPDRFERPTWLAAMVGRRLTAEDLALAVRRLQAEARRLVSYYADWDVVLTPTLSRPPVPLGALDPGGTEGVLHEVLVRGRLGPVLKLPGVIELAIDRVFDFSPFTPVANFSGQPSMTVPLYWNAEGLPIGSMFTGRFGDEATLFRLGAQLEQARPWFERRPPIHAGAGSVAS
jgi:amidase